MILTHGHFSGRRTRRSGMNRRGGRAVRGSMNAKEPIQLTFVDNHRVIQFSFHAFYTACYFLSKCLLFFGAM